MAVVPSLFVASTESKHPDRELGRRLAAHLSRLADPQVPVIQALLADLLADDQAFLAPVRDLTARAGFLTLVSRIGQGGGQLERDALLQSLEPTYSARVLERLARFLDGLLDLPEPVAQPRPLPPSSVLIGPGSELVSASPPANRLVRRLALVTIFGVTAGLTATTVLLLRSGVLCSLSATLPFCGSSQSEAQRSGLALTPEQAIQAGLQAARQLATASDLPSFERALQELETSLLSLSSAPLAPELTPQQQGLEAIVRTARERLRHEQSDGQSLVRAREARDLALRQSDAATLTAVQSAISQLQAISSGSFSQSEARTLLRDLEAARTRLLQSVPATTDPGVETTPPTPPALPTDDASGSGGAGRQGNAGQRSDPL